MARPQTILYLTRGLVAILPLVDNERGRRVVLITLTGIILRQLFYKIQTLLIVLLIFESVTLLVVYAWVALLPGEGIPTQSILGFFLAAVSEACVAIACLVSIVREKGCANLRE